MENLAKFNLIGSSPPFLSVCRQIRKISAVEAPVLISGETGTGKELAARAIHYLGPRNDKPFIPVNCGALPESLVESELFGHERGAFTDAKTISAGLVSEANEGTLFLDEVDALSLKAQAALLRFLQDKTYRRVGGSTTRHADVRIVVASNAHLEKLVETRHFRRDLLYRLNVLSLHMPPLRERAQDALTLARTFMERFCRQYAMPLKALHPEAEQFIRQYPWPGNVRELENVIHRELLMCESASLRFGANRPASLSGSGDTGFKSAKAKAISEFERCYISDLLERTEGNITRAARLAGQDRSAFGKLVRKYGLGRMQEAGANP